MFRSLRATPHKHIWATRYTALRGLPSAATRPVVVRTRHPMRGFSSSTPRLASYIRFSPDPQSPFDFRRWDLATKVVGGLVVLSGIYYVTHLERVPETGRWRFMDISPKYEAKLGQASRAEVLAEFQNQILPPNHILTQHVHRVVSRVLASNNLGTIKSDQFSSRVHQAFGAEAGDFWDPDSSGKVINTSPSEPKEWNVLVVNNSKIVNAMAMPGTVVVFTGILPVCRDEEGLASVLSHEIAHVVARHIAERYSSSKVLLGLSLLLGSLGLDFGLSKALTTYILELPNSRVQEREADEIGLRLMAKACFDPRASMEMFARLKKVEDASSVNRVDFLNTHPSSAKRIEWIEAMLPEAYAIQAASPDCGGMQETYRAFQELSRLA